MSACKVRSSTSVFINPSILSKAFKGSGSESELWVPARSNQFVREVQWLSYSHIRIWGSMWVLADIKSGKSWKLVNANVANVNPPIIQSEIYPTGNRTRFVAVLTAVRRVQAHPNSQDCGYTGSKSRYNCMWFHSDTRQGQNKGSNNVDSTFNIRYVIRDSF